MKFGAFAALAFGMSLLGCAPNTPNESPSAAPEPAQSVGSEEPANTARAPQISSTDAEMAYSGPPSATVYLTESDIRHGQEVQVTPQKNLKKLSLAAGCASNAGASASIDFALTQNGQSIGAMTISCDEQQISNIAAYEPALFAPENGPLTIQATSSADVSLWFRAYGH